MKQTIVDFIDFIKYPCQSYNSNHKVCTLFLCGIIVFFMNLFITLVGLVYGLLQFDLPERKIFSTDENFFLFHLILVPIIEEIGFRLYLKTTSRNILLSSIVLIWIMIPMVIRVSEFSVQYLVLRCLISLPIGLSVFCIFNKILSKIKYSYLFYFSALFFGCMHIQSFVIDNINFPDIIYVLLVVIISSIGGILLGYVRVSIGIFCSIFFHFLVNFFPIMTVFNKI